MAAIRGNFPQLLASAKIKLLQEKLMALPEEYVQFMKVETTNRAYEEDMFVGEFGKPKRKRELDPIPYDDMFQGPTQRYIVETWANAWTISREMIEDEQYGVMRQMPSKLGDGVHDVVEQAAANVLNLGFTTQTTNDGLSFFHIAHRLLDPEEGTYTNRLAADLSITGLQEGILVGHNAINHRGLKRKVNYNKLYIPNQLQFRATEILKTPLRPYTGENTVNSIENWFTPVILRYLTSETAWFLSDDEKESGPCFFWRRRPEMDAEDDFDRDGTKHRLTFRFAVGVSNWQHWLGSNP